ncbi:MAG TPA: hypothetical protein VLE53_11250 [Gemmatimonadaceae bacterium]|nr:hypothetical protein [Gemmatimonadaceae bacterium]
MMHVAPRGSLANRAARAMVPAVLLSLLGLACESDDPVAPPQQSERIAIVNPPLFLNEGSQHQLQAVVLDATGAVDTMAVVSWESSRPDLASFDASGVLSVLAAAPDEGSVNATLLDPTIVRITARNGSEATERDIELRGWRYTRPAPGLGYHSPIAIRASEQRFTGTFDGVTLDAAGEPLALRLVCPTNQPGPTVTVALEAPAAMLDPASLIVSLDDAAVSVFADWTPDAGTPAASTFTLASIDATRFATALATATTATAQLVLASDPTTPVSVEFLVTGFDRFWSSGALLGSCA